MKLFAIAALLSAGSAAAYSIPSRREIRTLGQKTLPSAGTRHVGQASLKMEGESL